jgi:hypothetical protein
MPYRVVMVLAATLPLSVLLCAASAMLLPGGWRRAAIGVMVLAIPVWIGVASWLLAISSRRRCVAWLAGGNAAAFALFVAAKYVGSGIICSAN